MRAGVALAWREPWAGERGIGGAGEAGCKKAIDATLLQSAEK